MRFDSYLLEIILTPVYFCLALLLLTLVFHAFYVWFGNIKKVDMVFLKQVDYFWLLAAVVGLISLSNDLNEEVSQAYINNAEGPKTQGAYSLFRRHLETALPVCIPRFRGEFSPSNFEEINEDSKMLCNASRRVYKKMPDSISEPYPIIEALGFNDSEFLFDVKGEANQSYIKETMWFAERYREQQARYEKFRLAARHSNGYDFIKILLGPGLLAFALAVRITKVTVEVKLAKENKRFK
ncbi:hypothetical protein [Methylophilus aquaticus]|uniref:Uncharacterized protein n=1 Tax=Methylophilus aquaticus TaxID=1971610 RepID=A0ABT9JRP8_9PROT|nr:hypothetical protein [Methylophilus aquaticus]MDP8566786.1 hypothetical protein [Methylophilus aquaticus]